MKKWMERPAELRAMTSETILKKDEDIIFRKGQGDAKILKSSQDVQGDGQGRDGEGQGGADRAEPDGTFADDRPCAEDECA